MRKSGRANGKYSVQLQPVSYKKSLAQSWQRHAWDGLVSSCLLRFNRIWFCRLCWQFLLLRTQHLKAERYRIWIKKGLLSEKCVPRIWRGYYPAVKVFISKCILKQKVCIFLGLPKNDIHVNMQIQINNKNIWSQPTIYYPKINRLSTEYIL